MTPRIRCPAVVFWMLMLVAGKDPAGGQVRSVLRGVDSVDARVVLTWNEISRVSRPALERRLSTILQLELQTSGIRLAQGARNLLTVTIVGVGTFLGGVAYAYSVEFGEPVYPARVVDRWILDAAYVSGDEWNRLVSIWDGAVSTWAITWSGSEGVGYAHHTQVREILEGKVRELAQEFANAMLRAGS